MEFESTFPRYRNFIKPNTWKETGQDGGGLTYNLGAHVIDQAVQLFGMPEAVFADIATLRKDSKVDDYFIIHLLRPSKAPEVKITLKSSYLMCASEPRFVLHGREGSYVKYGFDPQEVALTEGVLPGTPHWGEEDKSSWGLLYTEKDGRIVHEPYPSLPGDYAAFYENIYRHIHHGKPLQSDAPGGGRSHPLDRSSLGKQPYAVCGSYLILYPVGTCNFTCVSRVYLVLPII